MAEKKPFLETLPGCLTGIGGTIAAVAALLTALYTTGVIGNRDRPTPVSSPIVTIQSPPPVASPPKAEATNGQSSEETPASVKEEYAMSPLEMGIDRAGEDYSDFASPSAQACSDACLKDPKCKAFVFNLNANQCWLKAAVPRRIDDPGFASGVKILK